MIVGHLASRLKTTNIKHLELVFMGIGDKEVEILPQMLRFSKVESLRLSHNNITDKGAEDLVKALQNLYLESLELISNPISYEMKLKILQAQLPQDVSVYFE